MIRILMKLLFISLQLSDLQSTEARLKRQYLHEKISLLKEHIKVFPTLEKSNDTRHYKYAVFIISTLTL